jgi:hypothetical protein
LACKGGQLRRRDNNRNDRMIDDSEKDSGDGKEKMRAPSASPCLHAEQPTSMG